jgi:hypothetical protein
VLAGNETFWEAVAHNINFDGEVEFISEFEKLEEIIVVAKESPWREDWEVFLGFGEDGSVSEERRREAEFWLGGVRRALEMGARKLRARVCDGVWSMRRYSDSSAGQQY